MTSDLRPVLEAVIFAEDVTPGERLKAIEQLRQLDGEHICPRCAVFDPPPDPDGFWEHTDDLLSSLVPFLDARGQARMPLTSRRMLEIVERETDVRARVISDASRIEAEIERRAEDKARELYEARSFQLVSSSESSESIEQSDSPPGPQLVATTEEACPETVSRPDTTLGWPSRERSGIRRLRSAPTTTRVS